MFWFFIIFSAISAVLATYITLRLFYRASFRRLWKFAIAFGIVGTLFLPVIMIIFRRSGLDNGVIDILVWSGYLGVGFLSFVFTCVVIRDLLWLPAGALNIIRKRLAKSPQKKEASNPIKNPSRRGFLVNSMNYGILTTAALSTGYGFAEARQTPQVKEVRVPIPHLPAQFEPGIREHLEGSRLGLAERRQPDLVSAVRSLHTAAVSPQDDVLGFIRSGIC